MAASSPVDDRRRVEYVTRNFADLQGLKMLPVAGVFAAFGASEVGLLSGTAWWVTFGLSVVVACLGVPSISLWYGRRFGRVEAQRDPLRSARMAAVAVGLLVVGIATMMLGASGWIPQLEVVSLPGIVLGIALALFGVAQGPIARREHPWTWRYGIAVAIISAAPLGAWLSSGVHPLAASGAMEFVIAGFFVVSSIDTHLALTRMLPGDATAERGRR
jgi:hypothetical protein